jgi:hypothetical protein
VSDHANVKPDLWIGSVRIRSPVAAKMALVTARKDRGQHGLTESRGCEIRFPEGHIDLGNLTHPQHRVATTAAISAVIPCRRYYLLPIWYPCPFFAQSIGVRNVRLHRFLPSPKSKTLPY